MIPVIIPARSGSKSIENKNLKLLNGRPLLEWAVKAAALSTKVDQIYVSSDSRQYIELAQRTGRYHNPEKPVVGIVRPPELAEDVPTELVILHAVSKIEDVGNRIDGPVVTLQCTTPLMVPQDIDLAVGIYQNSNLYKSVISVTPVREYPQWMFTVVNDELKPFLDKTPDGEIGVRQNLPMLLRPNGAIYVTSVAALKAEKTLFPRPIGHFWMPWQRSIDIDEPDDLVIAEAMARRLGL